MDVDADADADGEGCRGADVDADTDDGAEYGTKVGDGDPTRRLRSISKI